MKKQIVLVAAAVLIGATSLKAQGGFQRRTPEERTQAVMDKLADFKLDKDKSNKVDSIFLDYFKAQQKAREEAMAGGGTPDRDAMRASMQKLTDDRDAKLKLIFTEDQMKKWKDEIEPSMRPQRPQGSGGGK
jgi:periplasmic protein CpxP/Spy